MTGILWNFVSFIIALGILVAVHEFGHFWVARRCGVKVEKFSIGFGKSIWSKVGKDGTEYSLAVIPLGGYVKMLDGRVDDVSESEQQLAFDKKPLWKRSAIVAAGPAFNFLFAIVAYWLVFIIGVPAVKPVVGPITPYSIAADAGLEQGMELKSISGVKTADWESVNMGLISHIGDERLTMTVAPADGVGVEQTLTFDLTDWNFDPEQQSAISALGFVPFTPEISTKLVNITQDSAGARAGLQVGDTIVAINGQAITGWQQVVDSIQQHPNKPLQLEILREAERLDITIIPDSREVKGKGEIVLQASLQK